MCTVDGVFYREFVAFMKRVVAAVCTGDVLGKGTAIVCTDPGCRPETMWVEEGVSWFRNDGRGWYGSGVVGVLN